MIDRKTFFDAARSAPFGGSLTQRQVDGMTRILDEWEKRGLTDQRHLAYMLATTYWETAHTMQPIEEIGKGHGRPYGLPDPVTHQTYFGRGLVQLTWLANYRKAGVLVGQDLVNHPGLALQPDIASKILFSGMSSGLFTGKKLSDYFNATTDDPMHARRIINGLDHAQDIADINENFLDALKAAST